MVTSSKPLLITREELLNGQDKNEPLSAILEGNLLHLLSSLNKLRLAYRKPMIVSSGFRTKLHNERVGGAPNSAHMTAEACDFRDKDGELKKWCLANLPVLEDCGLYMEHPDSTPSWLHVQIRMPKSGSRVFKP